MESNGKQEGRRLDFDSIFLVTKHLKVDLGINGESNQWMMRHDYTNPSGDIPNTPFVLWRD